MQLKLIQKDYPEMSENDLKIIDAFIWNKCSEYYFIDYLRCTKGNVLDAIEFYKFDDAFRTVLTQFIIRFEIQIKTDFIRKVYKLTKSNEFYKDKKYYLPSALLSKTKIDNSQYYKTVSKIESEYKRMHFSTPGPLNYVALSFCSFGSFQSLYKYLNLSYKKEFIDLYTVGLPKNDFKILNSYLTIIRIIRNRCAHGNHIVTLKIKNQFNNHIGILKYKHISYSNYVLSVFDCAIVFLLNKLTCSKEFKNKIKIVMFKYQKLIFKYKAGHPFSTYILDILK